MSDNGDSPQSPPANRDLAGRIGKYEIIRKLGKGAMGVVYMAHDVVLDRDVALKIMAAQIVDDSELKTRFEREARAVARMTHPNVVTIYDLGSYEDSPFIAMELLKGRDLSQVMRQEQSVSLEFKVAVIAHVLAGLGHAHQAGVIHRDVKPANVFITSDGMVKIMDFGVAHITTASITGAGNIVGTAEYMSPEQVRGDKVDGRSDLFAAGCMLYEVVTGRRPFHADNLMAIFFKITHEDPDFEVIPKGSAHQALIPILRKALAKRREARYQTARDFVLDLRLFLRDHATSDSAQRLIEALDVTDPPTGASSRARRDGYGGVASMAGDSTAIQSGAPVAVRSTTLAEPGRARMPPSRPAAHRRPFVSSRAISRRHGAALFAMAFVVLGGGAAGVLLWQRLTTQRRTQTTNPSPPVASAMMPSAAPRVRSTAHAPDTIPPAPHPTFAEEEERSTAMRAAQAAFGRGDYDAALARAQEELRVNPADVRARRLADKSLSGQKARMHFRAAREALSAGDIASALTDAEAGRNAAPWDARGDALIREIREARLRAETDAARRRGLEQQDRVARIVDRADAALLAQDYARAIDLYDEALKLDPHNARAGQGKTGAVSARAMARAAERGPAPATKRFVSGRTVTQTAESRRASSVPSGFEPSDEVVVHRGARMLDLPGEVLFEVRPETVSPGQRYTVNVFLINQGGASIQLLDMRVSTRINGRKSDGDVPPQAKEVGPGQRALLLSQSGVWRTEYSSWSMEVTVRTIRGDVFRNEASWQ
ncbi:MAG: protein kinase [Vicinamibacteria bacterium]|nr:protein kinase [Vicinamibacteria bacterium]